MLARLDFAVPRELEDRKGDVRHELGIHRRVRIGIHPDIVAPMCVGLLRPVILWPTSENCPMNPRQRLASLTHELAHLRHVDDGIALLAELWRALAWFFLPVHLTMRFLHREREYRCDDLAAIDAGDARRLRPLAAGSGPGVRRVAASAAGRVATGADQPGRANRRGSLAARLRSARPLGAGAGRS